MAFWVSTLLISLPTTAQQPRYTFKKFVALVDTIEFKRITPVKDGFQRTYILTDATILDLDDDSTTYIKGNTHALLCFEGNVKNSKREGILSVYLIDSLDHSKRYRIWEQTYSNDKLNGEWKTYTLRGTLSSFATFKDDSLNGISRSFWIDGKSIMEETEYFNGRNKYILREYYQNGKLESEIPHANGEPDGAGKKYYNTGVLKESVELRNGKFDGVRKYYYPNGQLWIEQTYKEGKSWDVLGNYTENGQSRDAGTLRNGNGTIIFYNEDGTVRETITYVNGDPVK
jgi:antitoxin component YwqK of YwqJK toxin-antitoxin module